jgi:hypothetical protein
VYTRLKVARLPGQRGASLIVIIVVIIVIVIIVVIIVISRTCVEECPVSWSTTPVRVHLTSSGSCVSWQRRRSGRCYNPHTS